MVQKKSSQIPLSPQVGGGGGGAWPFGTSAALCLQTQHGPLFMSLSGLPPGCSRKPGHLPGGREEILDSQQQLSLGF